MSHTIQDAQLDDLIPVLARSDPEAIAGFVRALAADAATRGGMALRQLSWQLPPFSPLLDGPAIDAVEAAYKRSLTEPGLVQDADKNFVPSQLLMSVIPHREAEQQLDLLQRLPAKQPEWLDLGHGMKPLPAAVLETRLEQAQADGDYVKLRRVLFSAASSPAALTRRAREIIAGCLNSLDADLSSYAANVAFVAQDEALDDLVINAAATRDAGRADESEDAFWRARAVAVAVIRRQRRDMLQRVASDFAGQVATALGGDAIQRFADAVGRSVERLLRPVAAVPPSDAQLVVETDSDAMSVMERVDEVEADTSVSDRAAIPAMADAWSGSAAGAQRYAERQRRRTAHVIAFKRVLEEEGARMLAGAPPRVGLPLIVRQDPARVRAWLELIRVIEKPSVLRQIRNIGLTIAASFAEIDDALAAAVLQQLRDVRPSVSIVISREQTSLWEDSLFGAATGPAINALRTKAFDEALNDAVLEALVIAADANDRNEWLDSYVSDRLQAAWPGAQARGLTIAGLRDKDPHLDAALAEDWGSDFLSKVAEAARKTRDRHQWAKHWFGLAWVATDPVEFWRFGNLASQMVDRRAYRLLDTPGYSPLTSAYGGVLFKQIQKTAQDRTKARQETLFGQKAPPRDLALMLADSKP